MMVSTISSGNMHPNLPHGETTPQENFDIYSDTVGVNSSEIFGLRIDPGWNDGARVDTSVGKLAIPGSVAVEHRHPAHAIVTPVQIGAFVLSGDCYPFKVTASEHHAVGHNGWRSSNDNLMGRVVGAFEAIGYQPSELEVELGPGISHDSYVVEAERTNFLKIQAEFWRDFITQGDDHMVRIDLLGSMIKRMLDAGINYSNISIDPRDTYSDPNLFSRRASLDGLKPRGNHVFVVPAAT